MFTLFFVFFFLLIYLYFLLLLLFLFFFFFFLISYLGYIYVLYSNVLRMATKYSDIAVKAKQGAEISGEEADLIPYLLSKTQLSGEEVHTIISEFIFAGVDTVSLNHKTCMPCHEKTGFLPMRKQRRIYCTADQRLCFRYRDSTITLLPKSEFSRSDRFSCVAAQLYCLHCYIDFSHHGSTS